MAVISSWFCLTKVAANGIIIIIQKPYNSVSPLDALLVQ